MRRTALLAAPVITALAVFAGTGSSSAAGRDRPAAASGFRLQLFESCDELLAYARDQTLRLVVPNGLPETPLYPRATQFERPRGGVNYSTTNVQEEGIDEPDVVKTNGRHLFNVQFNRVRSVAIEDGGPRLADTLDVPNGVHELLLRKQRLLVISRGRPRFRTGPGSPRYVPPYAQFRTTLTEVDISNPSTMRVIRTLTLEGHYLAARLQGGVVRLVVLAALPRDIDFEYGDLERNRERIRTAPLAKWLPGYEVRRGGSESAKRRYLVQCKHVWRPRTFSGLGLLTVSTIDLDRGLEPTNTVALLSDGHIAYASASSLYVTTERWSHRAERANMRPARGAQTAIHKFGIASPVRTRYRASGTVPGFLLSQWSLSERDEILRVASTSTPVDVQVEEAETSLTTLEEQNGRLVHIGRLGKLGQGERVYAVRFVDDVGYVVTFRQVDPLYTVDLSEPRAPKLRGELMIPGWSSYLHPVGKRLLLGLGQDGTGGGEAAGLQLSLFDVSDLRRPERLHKRVAGRGESAAEYDHHAFLYWRPLRLVVIPADVYTATSRIAGAIGFRVGRKTGIREIGRITHPNAYGISRALVIGDSLYTVSDAGIEKRALRTFARRGWLAFAR